jgi:hypothetical protein
LYDDYVAHVRESTRRAATLGPASGIAGSALAMDLVHLLLTGCSSTAGAAVLMDLSSLSTRRQLLRRDVTCPVCQHLRAWKPKVADRTRSR